MLGLISLLGGSIAPDWQTKILPVLRYVLFGITVACAIVIIICILMQSSSEDQGNVITGAQDSYYSKNKGSTRNGKLKIVTIVMASIIAFCAIAYFVTELINKSGN